VAFFHVAIALAVTACDSTDVDESVLPTADTQLGVLRGGSVDTLCNWTRERLAQASGGPCDLSDPNAAPEYRHFVDFAGSSCGPEPKIDPNCTLTVDDYEACVDALVADACSAETTRHCSELGGCAAGRVELGLTPGCSGLSDCCDEIELETERERCRSVAADDSEIACGLELAVLVGLCPNASETAK